MTAKVVKLRWKSVSELLADTVYSYGCYRELRKDRNVPHYVSVFLAIVEEKMRVGNEVNIKRDDCLDNMSALSVQKARSYLIKNRIITPIPNKSRTLYCVNPTYLYRGAVKDLDGVIDKFYRYVAENKTVVKKKVRKPKLRLVV